MLTHHIKLGLGLIGIGREWGYVSSSVPTEKHTRLFLEKAFGEGIDYFDTAPAYGLSEKRLGDFLANLNLEQRSSIQVATKFGEHWISGTSRTYINHSYDALCCSLDQSIRRLGQIDIIQLHKTTPQVLESDAFHRALEYAQALGIKIFGASISDPETGYMLCDMPLLKVLQLPYNLSNSELGDIIDLAKKKGKTVIVNRPFNTGALANLGEEQDQLAMKTKAFRHILEKEFNGVILTGTKSYPHLLENIIAFRAAQGCQRQPKIPQ